MKIEFQCDKCGRQYRVTENMNGKRIRCKECKHSILVGKETSSEENQEQEGARGSLLFRFLVVVCVLMFVGVAYTIWHLESGKQKLAEAEQQQQDEADQTSQNSDDRVAATGESTEAQDSINGSNPALPVIETADSTPEPEYQSLEDVNLVNPVPVDWQEILAAVNAPDFDRFGKQLATTEAVVEVTCPPDTTIQIGSLVTHDSASMTIPNLSPQSIYKRTIKVEFADGSTATRDVYVQAGCVTRLSVSPPDSQRPQSIAAARKHSSKIEHVEYSSDGTALLTKSRQEVILWDVASGHQVWTYIPPEDSHASFQIATFTADGESVVTKEERYLGPLPPDQQPQKSRGRGPAPIGRQFVHRLTRWSLESGEALESKEISGLSERKVQIKNELALMKQMANMLRGKQSSNSFPVNESLRIAGGKLFGWRPRDGAGDSYSLIDLGTGEAAVDVPITREMKTHRWGPWFLSSQADKLLLGLDYQGRDEECMLFELNGETEPQNISKDRDDFTAALFAPDGSWLVMTEQDATRIIDATTYEQKHLLLGDYSIQNLTGRPVAMAVSGDSQYLAASVKWNTYRSSVSTDKHTAIFIWAPKEGKLVRRIDLPGETSLLTFSPDNSQLCAVTDEKIILVPLESAGDRINAIVLEEELLPESQVIFDSDEKGYQVLGALADSDHPDLCEGITVQGAKGERGDRYDPIFHRLVKAEAEAEKQEGEVTSISASPDGKWIVTGLSQNSHYSSGGQPLAVVYDRKTLRKHRQLKAGIGANQRFTKTRFTNSGLLMTATTTDEQLHFSVWDPVTGKQLRKSVCVLKGFWIGKTTISPDGRFVAASCGPQAVLWDASSGQELARFPAAMKKDPSILHVAFSKDGEKILVGEANIIRFWDTNTRNDAPSILYTHPLSQKSIDIDPAGNRLAATFADPLDRKTKSIVWDLNRGVPIYQANAPQHDSLYLSPNGTRMLLSSGHLVNINASTVVAAHQGISSYWHQNISPFSPSGMQIVCSTANNSGYTPAKERAAIDAWTGEYQSGWWFDHLGEISNKNRFSHCHALLANRMAISMNGVSITVVDTETQQLVRSISAQDAADEGVGGFVGMALSPDGKFLAAGCSSTVLLYDLSTGERIPMEHKKSRKNDRTRTDMRDAFLRRVRTLQFSSDGSKLLARSMSHPNDTPRPHGAVIWDLETKKQLFRTIEGRERSQFVRGGFSQDGNKVLLAAPEDADFTAGVWDLNGKELLMKVPDTATRVCMNSQGTKLICGQADGSVKIYDILSGEELIRLFVFEDGWVAVTPQGYFDGSPAGREQVYFQLEGSVTALPLERFFSKFYYPGLLGAVWNGERPISDGIAPKTKAPQIQILASNSQDDPANATVDIAVTDLGGGVSIPWITQNGVRISDGKKISGDEKSEVWRFTASLVPGRNMIEAHCTSANGLIVSEPAKTSLDFQGRVGKPDLYVVSIGVNKYRDDSGVSPLDFCVSDAKAISELFQTRTAGIYEKIHVTELLDEEATRSNILNALGQLTVRCRPQDTLVVYVASHGLTVGQRFFILPQEFRLPASEPTPESTTSNETTAVALRGTTERQRTDMVRQQGLAVDQITDQLAQIPTLRRVLIFDTCQSGGATQLIGQQRNPFGFRGAVERSGQGVFVIAATSADELAAESKELGHSLLTYALLESVGATDSQGQRKATGQPLNVDSWFKSAAKRVPGLYEKYIGRPQQIEMSGSAIGFPILMN